MPIELQEAPFEDHITHALVASGYVPRQPQHYDAARGLDVECFLNFVRATQPETLALLERGFDHPEDALLNKLVGDLAKGGALTVLRKGVELGGRLIHTYYTKPTTGLSQSHRRHYQANCFSVMRQLVTDKAPRYSKGSEILDLTLFLNGIPLVTAELKTPSTGQTVTHAKNQYINNRDPNGVLLKPGRCLAHFAVDTDWVFVTTALAKKKTRFLPFNKGYQHGAANPPNLLGYKTAYLWEDVWQPESMLELVEHFVHKPKKGKEKGKAHLIFPRYHQRQTVQDLLEDARRKGAGQQYLIQHSAGSGKSFTIAWLAHRLVELFDAANARVFDTIVVLTDRTVLDRQLQRTIGDVADYEGKVTKITGKSGQLADAISKGKQIIVTTQQKFSVIDSDARALTGAKVAIIIDEAHSSQDGETSKSVNKVLGMGVDPLAAAEAAETDVKSVYDRIQDDAVARMAAPNISIFAFTATPKKRTMQLFGVKQPDGSYEPFRLYSMRQAIEEEFILDVLQNYMSYGTYWELRKTIAEDPRYESRKVMGKLISHVELEPHAVKVKVGIMLDHFLHNTANRLDGKAKAMIVTRSRLHAVRYVLALRDALGQRATDMKALVAFSESVPDPDTGQTYTEAGLNGFPDTQTVTTFKKADVRFIVVANKLQTGFDEPLLHTMYVDKRLDGVNTIQTLSRLNRTMPGKEDTFILDFANNEEKVRQEFQDRYQKTVLKEGIEPQRLHDLYHDVMDLDLFSKTEVDAYALIAYDPKRAKKGEGAAAMRGMLDRMLARYLAFDEAEQREAKTLLRRFEDTYGFVSKILTVPESTYEKTNTLVRHLLKDLPVDRDALPPDVTKQVALESYRVRPKGQADLSLEHVDGELRQSVADRIPGATSPEEEEEALSEILEKLNERFGLGKVSDSQKAHVKDLLSEMMTDAPTDTAIGANDNLDAPKKVARDAFNRVKDGIMDKDLTFFKHLSSDYGEALYDYMYHHKVSRRHEWLKMIADGESKHTEFKSTWNFDLKLGVSKSDSVMHSSVKTIAAFLNGDGGCLFIGVDDNGRVLGTELGGFDDSDSLSKAVADVVKTRLGIVAASKITPAFQTLEKKLVCRIYCPKGKEPTWMDWPTFQKTKLAKGDLYIRAGATTPRVEDGDVEAFLRDRFPEYYKLYWQGDGGAARAQAAVEEAAPMALQTLDAPTVAQRYVDYVPLVPLQVAAGVFSLTQDAGAALAAYAETWVKLPTKRRVKAGFFAARIVGRSMEPKIADGSVALFAPLKGGSKKSRIVLAQLHDRTDPEHGGRYTVKCYESDKVEGEDGNARIVQIRLVPLNKDFRTLVFEEADAQDLRIIAEYQGVIA